MYPNKMSAEDQLVTDNLQYLFHRPKMPLYLSTTDVMFLLPRDYWHNSHRITARTYQMYNRRNFYKKTIKVKSIPMLDISLAVSLDRNANFTVFNIHHQSVATHLIDILTNMADIHDFLSACCYCRERVNPFLFVYAASVAMRLREDTKNAPFPTHVQCFPELYLNGSVFRRIREISSLPVKSRVPIKVPFQLVDPSGCLEGRLAYWREDAGINLRHWNWYMVNPSQGYDELLENYRRGEYFIYMYEQILARYNFERLCNGLNRVEPLSDTNCIVEGYVSSLCHRIDDVDSRWSTRKPNSLLKDIYRPDDYVIMSKRNLERWVFRLYEAILGKVRFPNFRLRREAKSSDKLNLLGNLIENNCLNVYQDYYGPLRTTVLMMLGYIHDPDGVHRKSYGNICDPATSMRDPLFYRWHATLDLIVQEQKSLLAAYTVNSLRFQTGLSEVRITAVEVITDKCNASNVFVTCLEQSEIDFSKGLDFDSNGPVYARVTHLQHAPFEYRIQVKNPGKIQWVTVRIYLAPKFDEEGRRFSFEQQRLLFIEQDQFLVHLRSGNSTIKRHSKSSTVTMSRRDIFPDHQPASVESFKQRNWLGWPHYMLIPMGREYGYPCELFVMISSAKYNPAHDERLIRATDDDSLFKRYDRNTYHRPLNYRLNTNTLEDGRPYGFPFDRPAAPDVKTLAGFLTPNMRVTNTFIRFNNRRRNLEFASS